MLGYEGYACSLNKALRIKLALVYTHTLCKLIEISVHCLVNFRGVFLVWNESNCFSIIFGAFK